jgi:hypothetical protein
MNDARSQANAVLDSLEDKALIRQQIEANAPSNPRIASAMSANPFAVLECTVRDSSEQIIEMAENRSLLTDPSLCTAAKSTLVNPRLRLGAELGWLPGVAPSGALDLVSAAEKGLPIMMKAAAKLPNVAACNLLMTTIEASAKYHPDDILFQDLFLAFFDRVEKIDETSELRLINEDRAIARFPEVTTGISDAVEECRKQWRERFRPVLLETAVAAKGLGNALDTLTEFGSEPAPPFVSAIIADHTDDIEPQLRRLKESAEELIEGVKRQVEAARGLYPEFQRDYGYIVEHILTWHRLTNAMQLVAQSHGTDEPFSVAFGYALRGLSLFLTNEYGIYDVSEDLTRSMGTYLRNVESFKSKMQEDQAALSDLQHEKLLAQERERKEIEAYSLDTEVGGKRLIIDAKTISYRGTTIALADITSVRYGVYKHYTNGIRDSRKYTVWVGSSSKQIEIECATIFAPEKKVEALYGLVTDKVWSAVCLRLVHEVFVGLLNDKKYKFGNAVFDRTGVTLTRKRFWKADEPIHCKWEELSTGNEDGYWRCWCTGEAKLQVRLSYRGDNNTHIIAAVLRFLWKDGNYAKLARGTLFT